MILLQVHFGGFTWEPHGEAPASFSAGDTGWHTCRETSDNQSSPWRAAPQTDMEPSARVPIKKPSHGAFSSTHREQASISNSGFLIGVEFPKTALEGQALVAQL